MPRLALWPTRAHGSAWIIAWKRKFGGGVGGNITHPLAEPEQALDRREGTSARDGGQARLNEGLREALEVP